MGIDFVQGFPPPLPKGFLDHFPYENRNDPVPQPGNQTFVLDWQKALGLPNKAKGFTRS